MNDVFGRLELSVIVEKLENACIANGVLSSVADLSDHVLLQNSVVNIGGFDVSLAALPVQSLDARPIKLPGLGQHTDALRREFGGP